MKLFEEHNGRRHKLLARSGKAVESMFVDRRGNMQQWPNGNILVITCEGNAGFLELGCMVTPLEVGYSVLGWNHPGFGGSEGVPWPAVEREAIEVVVQFAVEHLGYPIDQIYIYAWSIGGFAATWAAHVYPQLGGLVLDATFDDLLPLARARMPPSWGRLVQESVREYLDLPICDQLVTYNGPVSLIRRTQDEMICLDDQSPETQRATNRANDLLKKLLRYRYPEIFTDSVMPLVDDLLSGNEHSRNSVLNAYKSSEGLIPPLIGKIMNNTRVDNNTAHVTTNEVVFPLKIPDDKLPSNSDEIRRPLAIHLALHHLSDFDSTHCVPLPGAHFKLPTHPWQSIAKAASLKEE